MIQYQIKPLISLTTDVTFGKLMAVQSLTSAYQKTACLKILANKNLKKMLITIKPQYNAKKISPTKLPEQQFCLIFYVQLPHYNCSVQTVDIVNPPGINCPASNLANVSYRTSIFLGTASKVAENRCAGVQTIVPKSIT
jgi:hypothetical protein